MTDVPDAVLVLKLDLPSLCDSSSPPPTLEPPQATNVPCHFCQKHVNRTNLSRHAAICPKNPFPTPPLFTCQLCGKNCSRSDRLKAHVRLCENGPPIRKNALKKCKYPECKQSFFHKKFFIDHLKKEHQAEIQETRTLKFTSYEKFQEWRKSEETRTYSFFSQQSGMSVNSSGRTIYLYCQQDGSSRSHRKSSEASRKTNRRVKIGQIKRDRICIASMKVTIYDDGSVSVRYYPTHDHPLNPEDRRYHPFRKVRKSLLDAAQNTWNKHEVDLGVSPKCVEMGHGNEEANIADGGSFDLEHVHEDPAFVTSECMEDETAEGAFTNDSPAPRPKEELDRGTACVESVYKRIELNLANLSKHIQDRSLPLHLVSDIDATLEAALKSFVLDQTSEGMPEMLRERSMPPGQTLLTSQPFVKKQDVSKLLLASKKCAPKKDGLSSLSNDDKNSRLTTTDSSCQTSQSSLLLSFTPHWSLGTDLRKTVLVCEGYKISLLHLKSLELELSRDEELACKSADVSFSNAGLYGAIINAFLSILAESLDTQAILIDSDTTFSIYRGSKKGRFLRQPITDKSKFLFPVSLSDNQWIIIAAISCTAEILFYDPMQEPIREKEAKLLDNVCAVMNVVKPEVTSWTLKSVSLPRQCTATNCGPLVCWFAHQIMTGEKTYGLLRNTLEYRKFMFSVISGGCFKWTTENENQCGVCKEVSVPRSSLQDFEWMQCLKCDQGFHRECLSLTDIDEFECPL